MTRSILVSFMTVKANKKKLTYSTRTHSGTFEIEGCEADALKQVITDVVIEGIQEIVANGETPLSHSVTVI